MSRSSTVGSINEAQLYKHLLTPAYKVTKAAVNMLTIQWAADFGDKGFTFVAISPGVRCSYFAFCLLSTFTDKYVLVG